MGSRLQFNGLRKGDMWFDSLSPEGLGCQSCLAAAGHGAAAAAPGAAAAFATERAGKGSGMRARGGSTLRGSLLA